MKVIALFCVGFLAAAPAVAQTAFTVPGFTLGPDPTGDPTVGVLPSYNDASANWANAGVLDNSTVSSSPPKK